MTAHALPAVADVATLFGKQWSGVREPLFVSVLSALVGTNCQASD